MKKVFFISLLFIFWFILVPWALLVFETNKIIRRSHQMSQDGVTITPDSIYTVKSKLSCVVTLV